MLTPLATLCLSTLALLCALLVARKFLIDTLSKGEKTAIALPPSMVPSAAQVVNLPVATHSTMPVSSAENISAEPVSPVVNPPASIDPPDAVPVTSPPVAPVYSPVTLTSKLQPAEIAFLVRGGDVNHTLIVLAVDLIQRSLQPQPDASFMGSLADYERNMWKIVSRSIKDWATQKAHQTILGGATNPIHVARRIVFLFNFIRNSLRGLIADTIADPKRLKKYFSPTGVLRIIADFTSAGYKKTFEEELRKSLLRRGLLVPEATRQKVGWSFFRIGIIGVLATAVMAFYLLPSAGVAFVTWSFSATAGLLARIVLSVRSLIPFYEELAIVVDQVERKSVRLKMIKMLLRSVGVLAWVVLFLIVSIILAIAFGIIKLIYAAAGASNFAALVVMTVAHFAIADFVFNGIRLNIEEQPTKLAEEQLKLIRKELADISPLDTFRNVLATSSYDPTFSKLLAVYGVETLFILI